MNRLKRILLTILLASLTICFLFHINGVLEPKHTYRNSDWPTSSSYAQFYKMKKNSVDVLFLGSSEAETAFIPQVLYNKYGIRSYNLACEQQSIFLSYYWLKEALRSQSPKTVVLDLGSVFSPHPESPIDTSEGISRICLGAMQWSAVKAEAVSTICKLDPKQTWQSWIFTNLRFHSRWKELSEVDFSDELNSKAPLYGYTPIFDNSITDYSSYQVSDSDKKKEIRPLMKEYLDRIVQLCHEKDISLLLVNVPVRGMQDGINNFMTAYASQNGLTYLNMSLAENFNAIGADLPSESPIGHENVLGAVKTSTYIGQILSSQYDVPSVKDSQWEEQNDFFNQILNDEALVQCKDFSDYMDLLGKGQYTVLMAVNDDMVYALNDERLSHLRSLGIKQDFSGRYFMSWCAAIDNGKVSEKGSDDGVALTGPTGDGLSIYSMDSEGRNAGRSCSIKIDGTEYAVCTQGLNIVVYDDRLGKVIDSVTFNLAKDGSASRHA